MSDPAKSEDYKAGLLSLMQQAMADDRQRRERDYREELKRRQQGGAPPIIGQNGFSGSVVTSQ